MKNLSTKEKFNALSNAAHICAYKEEGVKFKIVELMESTNSMKAIIELEDGSFKGLFTDSKSAIESMKEVVAVFGDKQPFIVVKMRQTAKGMSVYFCEVL